MSELIVAFVAEHCTLDHAAHTSTHDLWIDFLAWKNPSGVCVGRRMTLFPELCVYLRQLGCTEDLDTKLWTGVRLQFPRQWLPALDPTTQRLAHPVSEEALASALAWLRQHMLERQGEDQETITALLSQPRHQASEDVGRVLAKRRAAQEQLMAQYNHYLTTRHVPFLPGGAKPSTAEEIQLACEVMLEVKEEGFSFSLVLEVIAFLRQLIEHGAVPMNARRLAQELLQAFYAPVVPKIQTHATTAMDLSSYHMRVELLQWYEQHKAKVDGIWKKLRRASARLAALSDAYEGLSEARVQHWQGKRPAYIAASLAGSYFGMTAETARKVLQQARAERKLVMEK